MNRRRNFEDSDEDRSDRPRKRRRNEDEADEEIELRLESLIVRVGEKSTSSLESNIEELSTVLNADISEPSSPEKTHKDKIIRSICDSVAKFPDKTCIYSTLVGLLNARNYSLGGEIVESLVVDFKNYLKSLELESARLLVRFFADLVNCRVLSSASLITLFENLMDVSMEDNIPQSRSDYFVFTVLSALPWVGKELYEKKEQDLEQLLNTIDNYLNKRQKTHHHTALRVWYSDTPHPQEEYLDCFWAQISKLRSDKWVERHIYRPYLAFDGILCEALQHTLAEIHPPPHESTFVYPYPKVIFRLFDYTDCPDGPVLPGAHSIERYLIEERLHWIIEKNYQDRKTCAMNLLGLPQRNRIPLEYMIIEVIFSELFALPKNRYLDICYGSILLELCKLQPSSLPQVLAQAVELIFERLDTMNCMCVDRFANWFAYHLSNFQFRWSWDDWSTALTLDPLHPKPKFIRETLLKCLRLSFHEQVIKIIPDSFLELAPEDPLPENKFTNEGTEVDGSTFAHTLMNGFKAKCSPEEALNILKDLTNPLMETEEEPNHNPLKIEVFVTVLLNLASKSLTHLFSAIAKYHSALKELSTSEEAQFCILSTIFQVWTKHQQLLVVLISKLLKSGVLECSSVANWLFSKQNSGEFMKSYVWEILNQTIQRSIKSVESLEKEVEESKEKQRKVDDSEEADKPEESESPTQDMIDAMEDRLEAAQSDQKNLFLIIFNRFIMLLSEHIQKCESNGKSFKNHWFRWTIGRLQQIFFEHHNHVFKYVSTFESLLFTAEVDQHILLIFKQFCSLRN